MTREDLDFIGSMNMCDEISNEAYKKIMCHCKEQEPCEDCIDRAELLEAIDTWDKFGFDHTGCFAREPKDDFITYVHYDDVIKCIKGMPSVQPKAEWIPVSERLPEEAFGCIVTVWDTNPMTMNEFENILPYFVGWDGEQWNDADGEQCPFEVIAWMPLSEPYKEG